MIRAHQPGSQPVDIPEAIPNPAVPRTVPTPTPAPKEPIKVPAPQRAHRPLPSFEYAGLIGNHLLDSAAMA
jgi:hypothetical protein